MDILVTLLCALGIFFVVRKIAQLMVTSLLHGRLNTVYLGYVHNRQGKRTGRALVKEDVQAWDEIADAKLAELSARRYDTRKRALDYLENVAPTTKLAAGLMAILPLQHCLAVQERMACLLHRTLKALQEKDAVGVRIRKGIISRMV